MSARPASLRLATTFDPMNPAPPVTNNIDAQDRLSFDRLAPTTPLLCPSLGRRATLDVKFGKLKYEFKFIIS
jgi:hypothetical protein